MAVDWPEARELALAAILPAGTDRYVALFLGNPIDGGTEITLTGYARVAFQNWSTSSALGESNRSNASAIVFPTITQAGTADYWAIFDASMGGTLLRSSVITNDVGAATPAVFSGGGDEARFVIGALSIRAEDAM